MGGCRSRWSRRKISENLTDLLIFFSEGLFNNCGNGFTPLWHSPCLVTPRSLCFFETIRQYVKSRSDTWHCHNMTVEQNDFWQANLQPGSSKGWWWRRPRLFGVSSFFQELKRTEKASENRGEWKRTEENGLALRRLWRHTIVAPAAVATALEVVHCYRPYSSQLGQPNRCAVSTHLFCMHFGSCVTWFLPVLLIRSPQSLIQSHWLYVFSFISLVDFDKFHTSSTPWSTVIVNSVCRMLIWRLERLFLHLVFFQEALSVWSSKLFVIKYLFPHSPNGLSILWRTAENCFFPLENARERQPAQKCVLWRSQRKLETPNFRHLSDLTSIVRLNKYLFQIQS